MIFKKLTINHLDSIYALCRSNLNYYHDCPPMVSKQSIIDDMNALPPNKQISDKYYMGIYMNHQLVAILDYIYEYPNNKTNWIGFFMVDHAFKRKHIGKQIIEHIIKQSNHHLQLGVYENNLEAIKFWEALGFKRIKQKANILIYEYQKN